MYFEKSITPISFVSATEPDDNFVVHLCRWFAVILPALCVTLLIVFFMHKLVFTEFEELPESTPLPQIDVHFEEPPLEDIKNEKPKEPEAPPMPPEAPNIEPMDHGEIDFTPPKMVFKPDTTKIQTSSDAGVPVAHFHVTAKYPSSAIRRGIEGYVDVLFDVNEAGIPKNIRITAAVPQGVFENAAIKAVEKWRYKPKMSRGKPQYFAGLSKRIRFELGQ